MKDYLTRNYHTHTKRCHHAEGIDREYVESAIRAGIKVLGFADHVPIPDCPQEIAGIRMTEFETEDYVRSVLSLREEYKADIKILLGYECEYLPDCFERQMKFLKNIGYDYLILGQHFLEEFNYTYMGVEIYDRDILTGYVDTCIKALATGEYAYLCHPDLVHYCGDRELYRSELKRLCSYCKEQDIPMEINLLGILTHRYYPNTTLFELMSETGNKVILGLDAHKPEQIGIEEPYRIAMGMVEKFRLELIDDPFWSLMSGK